MGASRYCRWSLEKKKPPCSHADSCLGMVNYGNLSGLNSSCPFVRSLNKKGELFEINQESILNHIKRTNTEKSYERFEKKLREYLDGESKDELWNHVSFINYLQCILSTKDTPPRATVKGLFDESKVIVEKTISLLDPDIIVLWGSATIIKNMRITSKKEAGCSRLFSDCLKIKDSVYDIKIENKAYPLMLTNSHPSYPGFKLDNRVFSGFVEHVKNNV